MDELLHDIGKIWSDRRLADGKQPRTNWLNSPTVLEYLSRLVCGSPYPDLSMAIARLLRDKRSGVPFERAISVGCGNGTKEMALIREGLVTHFDLYEIAEASINQGRNLAEKQELQTQVEFFRGHALEDINDEDVYDLVYWDNALHHMFDVEEAVRWSRKVLKPGGMFFMYEYVGPNRFQWTEMQMQLTREVLQNLDDVLFLIPDSEHMWKKEPKRSTVEEMIAADPSEAPDSERILDSVKLVFPDAGIVPLGGLVYVLCLDGILINIPEQSALLKRFLSMDALFSRQGHNLYAAAWAFKHG